MKKTFFAALLCAAVVCTALCSCAGGLTEDETSVAVSAAESLTDTSSADVSEDSAESSVESVGESDLSDGESSAAEPTLKYGSFEYVLTNDVAKLVTYTGDESELTLPADIEGHTLTAVESGAFEGRDKLKRLDVGDSVVNLADGALSGCTALEELSLGGSVAVFCVDDVAGCATLKEVNVANSNTVFSSHGGLLYGDGGDSLILCPRDLTADDLVLPSGLLKIEDGAFAECVGVKKVSVPAGCALGKRSFFHCTKLESVELGEGTTAVPEKCFFGCVALKRISVPEGVTEIGDLSFFGCVALTGAELPSTLTSIGKDVFKCCPALKTISVKGEYATDWYNETGKEFLN